ncbi:MAG: M61 family metallopeptidase [Gammaproteobacteria bacterium]|nr:M61 family metallopeptidase [Gammaproteobacteria bacterium]MCP5138167.1 M61 family metallopeptidase [Gammaproteobacteria bacterium]
MNSPTIVYRIHPVDPKLHTFEIVLEIASPDPAGQRLSMPAWIPGSYMIRDFARNVTQLAAESAGQSVATRKLDKQTWICDPCTGPLTIRYQVYAWDLSVRSAHLDTTHAYFNGSSVFLAVDGQTDKPCAVDIQPPARDAVTEVAQWQVATSLPRDGAAKHGFGRYRADDYDALIDHPVEIGNLTFLAWESHGVPHEMAIYGRHDADTDRLAADLKRICETHIDLFGQPAPMDYYLFLVMAVGDGVGGLEHRASTSLICRRDDLPRRGAAGIDKGYRDFLGLCSHEYFHTWNVKRIKPTVFLPYDLSQEVHTPLLWAFEGITSYYDDLGLHRSGLVDTADYLDLLAKTLTRVQRATGRRRQTVTESSFDTWTRFYKQDENAPNAIVSYYTKGAQVALALDLKLRLESDGAATLDDLMRRLWQDFGQRSRGVGDDDIQALASELAGTDLSAFFTKALHSTDDIELADLLGEFGVDWVLRAAANADDAGGRIPTASTPRVVLGARIGEDPVGARVLNVYEHGAAHQAGLSAGDVIIAVDGLRATSKTLDATIARGGERPRTISAFRRDELMSFTLRPLPAPHDTIELRLSEATDASRRERRASWLQD